jgi:hypothetical protein
MADRAVDGPAMAHSLRSARMLWRQSGERPDAGTSIFDPNCMAWSAQDQEAVRRGAEPVFQPGELWRHRVAPRCPPQRAALTG